jgi:glycosyltransferase involved in cell wall biosynthesis
MNSNSLQKLIILIPFYNDKNELRTTLQSIEEPVYDFSIVIVNDGSSKEQSPDSVIMEFNDKFNITCLSYPFNQGVRRAINHGLLWCFANKEFNYIAILDCGDTNEPNRFSLQHSYLEDHSQCMVIGGGAVYMSEFSKNSYQVIFPQHSKTIRKNMFVNLMFCHPSIMFRKECIQKYDFYPPGYDGADDHAFLFPIVLGSETVNLQQKVITCLIRKKGISCQNKNRQIISRIKLIWKYRDFSFKFYYGLLRNILLLFLPKRLMIGIRNHFKTHKFK